MDARTDLARTWGISSLTCRSFFVLCVEHWNLSTYSNSLAFRRLTLLIPSKSLCPLHREEDLGELHWLNMKRSSFAKVPSGT